jgi:hypothetical protein
MASTPPTSMGCFWSDRNPLLSLTIKLLFRLKKIAATAPFLRAVAAFGLWGQAPNLTRTLLRY